MATELPRVIVTKPFVGLAGMQVCAVDDASDEEILALCNSENPAGTATGWGAVIRDPVQGDPWRTEDVEPVACADNPGRSHFIVLC